MGDPNRERAQHAAPLHGNDVMIGGAKGDPNQERAYVHTPVQGIFKVVCGVGG